MFYIIKDRRIIKSSSTFIEWDGVTYELNLLQEPHLCPGCLIDVVEWVATLTHNAECEKIEIEAKLQRMQEIKIEIRNLWGVDVPTYTALDTANASRIAELTTEFDLIKAEVDTYEPTLIDDVLASFFD